MNLDEKPKYAPKYLWADRVLKNAEVRSTRVSTLLENYLKERGLTLPGVKENTYLTKRKA